MQSVRVQRQVTRLLDEVEVAVDSEEWLKVRNLAQRVLIIDPEQPDARSYLDIAERGLIKPVARSAEATSAPSTTRRILSKFGGPYAMLLVTFLVLLAVIPLLSEWSWSILVFEWLLFAVIVFDASGATHNTKLILVLAALAVFGRIANLIQEVLETDNLGPAADSMLQGLFFLGFIFDVVILIVVGVLIMRDVLRRQVVTTDAVLGSICVFLLDLGFWAALYTELADRNRDAFAVTTADDVPEFGEFLYFSVITQTTVGYGDIVPLSALAQAMSALQSIVGQVFVIVIVARFVGLQVAHATR